MRVSALPAPVARKPPGHDPVRGGLRFAAELIAWVAVPWALWQISVPLAVAALLLLIVPPAVFSTPGDRPGGDTPIAAPGIVTIASVLAHLAGATVAAWFIWPPWIAVVVTYSAWEHWSASSRGGELSAWSFGPARDLSLRHPAEWVDDPGLSRAAWSREGALREAVRRPCSRPRRRIHGRHLTEGSSGGYSARSVGASGALTGGESRSKSRSSKSSD